MDKITLLQSLDRSAAIMRRVGFHSFTRFGRRLFKCVLKDLSVEFNDLRMSGPIELRGHLYQVRTGQMEPFMSDLFKDAVKPGAVVLDIGACLGYYALLAASQGAKVYAFEPDYTTFSHLVANIQRNGFTDRVTAVSKAVSDRTGVASFLLHESPVFNSLFYTSGEVKTTVPVECTTVDEFLDETVAVDLIKMDIEGAELHALKGMKRMIARASSHLIMFVECRPQGLQLTGGSAGALIQQLRELGLTVMVIDEKNRRLSPVDSGVESVKYINLYCSRNKESL